MNFKRLAALALALGLCAAPAWADIYIRNRPITKSVERDFVRYVQRADLTRYFSSEELARCSFDPATGAVTVDGKPLEQLMISDDGEMVPLIPLAEALGFQKKVNRELGITDYVAPPSEKVKDPVAAARNHGGSEYRMGEQRMAKVLQKTPKLDNHQELARVEKIGQQIVAVSDMPNLPWNFFIVADTSPNAFCTGAGWVAVTHGLLALKLTDDELAGVLAHEVGHGCRKDLEEASYNKQALDRHENDARRLDRELTTLYNRRQQLVSKAQYAREMAQVTSGAESSSYRSQASDLAAQVQRLDRSIHKLERSLEAAVKGYRDKEIALTDDVLQRKDEYDADIKGIYYATRAGFSPNGLMDSLRKMARHDFERFGAAAYQGGITHPPVSERIKTMNKVLSDWRNQR